QGLVIGGPMLHPLHARWFGRVSRGGRGGNAKGANGQRSEGRKKITIHGCLLRLQCERLLAPPHQARRLVPRARLAWKDWTIRRPYNLIGARQIDARVIAPKAAG